MDREAVVERLSELLELESRGLVGRLNEAQPFVHWADAAAAPLIERIAADQQEHQRRLTQQIVEMGGLPRPPIRDMNSARMHYLDLRYLLPLLIDDKRRRVAAYSRAAADIGSDSEAADIVKELLGQHQLHLEQLEGLARQVAPAGTT